MEVIVADTLRLIQLACHKLPDLSELSARDLFAMSAMNTIIHDNTVSNLADILNDEYKEYYLKKVPEAAYKIADAMLEARRTK